MRAPLSWLAEYTDLAAGATGVDVAASLVSVGLEEEDLHGGDITGPLVVGRVLAFEETIQKNGKPILDAATIAGLRPGVIVVNTARAALVDEAALLIGLENGAVESYATDVFDQEPPKDLTLARHPRVIATSHIGGFTDESVERATSVAIDHLLATLLPAPKAHVG